MKTPIALACSALLLVGSVLTVGSGVAFASGGKATGDVFRMRDNATGNLATLVFNAHEKVEMANGKVRPAKGMAVAESKNNLGETTSYWEVDVSCVYVDGNVATFGGVVTDSSGGVPEGDYVLLRVTDNGEPGVDDYVSSAVLTSQIDFALFCEYPSGWPINAGWTVIEGNLKVHPAR